jgi:hypothetical protein
MPNCLQFYNEPQRITGLDERKLEAEMATYRSQAVDDHQDFFDKLVKEAIINDSKYFYFAPARVIETWKGWRHFIWLLHKCIPVRNRIVCLAADECDGFREKFELQLAFGGSEFPVFGDEIMHYFDINEE